MTRTIFKGFTCLGFEAMYIDTCVLVQPGSIVTVTWLRTPGPRSIVFSQMHTMTRHIKFWQRHCAVQRPKNLTPWRDSNPGSFALEADAMTSMSRRINFPYFLSHREIRKFFRPEKPSVSGSWVNHPFAFTEVRGFEYCSNFRDFYSFDGVDFMITIFCDFSSIFGENIGASLKNLCYG
jgi:hypothetical protein